MRPRQYRLAIVIAAVLLAVGAMAAHAQSRVGEDHHGWPATWPFTSPPELRRDVSGLPAFWSDGSACSTGCRPRGAHFGWPLRPFHRQHALRAGLNELRSSSLHHGIDIQSPDGARVYALQPGRAHIVESHGAEERVQVGSYVYWHVNIRVREGQSVSAFGTVLGTTKNGFGHLHLSEIGAGGTYLNPLRPGGRVLAPWSESAAPVLARPRFQRDGRVLIEAFDPQSFEQTTTYRTPVLAPAALAYRVVDSHGHGVTRLYWSLRGSHNLDWSVHRRIYASDTRAPDFWCWIRHFICRPHWDYVLAGGLAPSLRTLGLRSGHYRLAAYAWDWAGNASTIRAPFDVHGRVTRRPSKVSERRAPAARAQRTDSG